MPHAVPYPAPYGDPPRTGSAPPAGLLAATPEFAPDTATPGTGAAGIAALAVQPAAARGEAESVRTVLAGKLARLLPFLPADEHDEVVQVTLKALQTLAMDQALAVRSALATALADVDKAPPAVCRMLAADAHQSVAQPILHYCVTLSDDDLVALLASHPEPWARSAIASRAHVSPRLSAAILEAGDPEATAILLANAGAELADPTLAQAVEGARQHRHWQMPLARRPGLPPYLAQRLATFASAEVMNELIFRHQIDPDSARDVVVTLHRRIGWREEGRQNALDPEARARQLFQDKRLDDSVVGDALANGERDFVMIALALLTRCPLATIAAVVDARSARGLTALAWKAGLSMRTAIQIQTRLAAIPPRRRLNARDGTGYPLSEIEMLWHLEFFGVPSA